MTRPQPVPKSEFGVHFTGSELAVNWETHLKNWQACVLCKSQLGNWAHKHALGRGHLPCTHLIVGEAPGKIEDLEGVPFVGPAGKLFQQALQDSNVPAPKNFFTNLLLCRPTDSQGGPNRTPSIDELINCENRLLELFGFAVPSKAFVALGRIPEAQLRTLKESRPLLMKAPVLALSHPAAILRSGGVESESYQRYVKSIQEVFSANANA
jgi:DNA polymerase